MKKETNELFVSHRYGCDIYEVFTTRKEADKMTTENNKIFVKSKNKFKTMTLGDAMEQMVDYVQETTENNIRYPVE